MGRQKRRDGVERRAARVLLLAVGEKAQGVATEMMALSRAWFAGEPPLVMLVAAARQSDDREFRESLAQACDALADQQRLERLQRLGWTLARSDELQVWLLLDSADGEGVAPCRQDFDSLRRFGKLSAHATEPIEVQSNAHVELSETMGSATYAAALLDQLAAIAWQRLRVHVVKGALLLAEPAQQALLLQEAAHLVATGVDQIYVAGPVNQAHVRLPAVQWQAQAATALTILLWNAPPSYTLLGQRDVGLVRCSGQPGADVDITALGGAAWLSPLSALKAWLAVRTGQAVVQGLQQGDQEGRATAARRTLPTDVGKNWDAVRQSYLAQAEAEVATLAPGGGMIRGWHGERPAWSALTTLAQRLVTETEERQERQQVEQQQMRRRWLATRMEAWDRVQQASTQERLTPGQGWPALTLYQTELTAQTAELQVMAEVIEERLAQVGLLLTRCEQRVVQAVQAVDALCRRLPAYTYMGAITALLQPWRWLGYGWDYWMRLPVLGQQLLDALAARQQAAWQEANWHGLRQVYLAMAQDVRRQLAWGTALQERLSRIEALLTTQAEALGVEVLAPWQPVALQHLWEQHLGDALLGGAQTDDKVTHLFQEMPLSQWMEQEVDRVVDGLLAWAGTLWPQLAHWSAVDCLTQAFAIGAVTREVADRQEEGPITQEDDLAGWLEHFAYQALPLWPDEEVAGEMMAESWLLTAPLALSNGSDRSAIDWATRSRAQLDAWRATQPDLLWGMSAVDGLLALQWKRVAGSPESGSPESGSPDFRLWTVD